MDKIMYDLRFFAKYYCDCGWHKELAFTLKNDFLFSVILNLVKIQVIDVIVYSTFIKIRVSRKV